MTNEQTLATAGARRVLMATALALALVVPAVSSASARTSVTGCPTSWSDGTGLVWLVYCHGTDGFTEIYERAPDGGVRQLTYMGWQATSPRISPDGSLLVFEAAGFTDPRPQIFAIPRDGARARRVLVGPIVIELDGVRATQLTDEGANTDPSFGLEGDRITFVSDRLGAPSIWSMDVDGADQREMRLADID